MAKAIYEEKASAAMRRFEAPRPGRVELDENFAGKALAFAKS